MTFGFFREEGTNRAIFMSMSFSLLAKVFNFAQSLAASYAFGTQSGTDILFYMLSVLILLSTLLSSVNHQIIVPNVIFLRTGKSEGDARKFISYIYFLYLVIGIAGTAVFIAWPESILQLFSRFDGSVINDNLTTLKWIMPAFLLIIGNTFILDIFTAYRYFTLPMVLDMLKNLIIISFILLFKDTLSISGLASGVLAGNLIQFGVLNYMLVIVLKCKPSFRRYRMEGPFRKNIAYVIIGHLTTFLSSFAAVYLMSGFNEGVYSAMDYGQKVNNIFSLVIVGQLATVVGMNVIEQYAKGDFDKLKHTFETYLKTGLFMLIPLSFIVSLNADGIVSVLFERGRFTSESAQLTGGFLRIFVLIVPYALINSFVVKLIVAKQIQRIAFFWQVSQSIGNIGVLWIMIHLFGYRGYPLGALIASYVYVIILMYFLPKQQFHYIDGAKLIGFLAINVIISAATMAVLYTVGIKADVTHSFADKLLRIVGSGILFLSIYAAAGYITGVNRKIIGDVSGKLLRRKKYEESKA